MIITLTGKDRRKPVVSKKEKQATEKFREDAGQFLAQFGVPTYITPGLRGQKRVGGQG